MSDGHWVLQCTCKSLAGWPRSRAFEGFDIPQHNTFGMCVDRYIGKSELIS